MSAVVVLGKAIIKGESVVPPAIAALPHVTALISDFLDHGTPHFWSIARACEHNRLALLPRLVARTELSADEKVVQADRGLMAAVLNDNLEMIQWLHAYCPRADTHLAMKAASAGGKLRLLQWIADHFECVTWSPVYAMMAAVTGSLETLQWIWLHPRRGSYPDHQVIDIIQFAAMNNHLAVITWLSEHDKWPRDDDTSDRFADVLLQAVRSSHLEVAKYVSEFGVSRACRSRMLEIVNTASQDAAMVEWVRGLPDPRQ